MDQKLLLRQQMRREMDDEIVQRTKSIKLRSQGLEWRPKAEKPWAQKRRVFRWLCWHTVILGSTTLWTATA